MANDSITNRIKKEERRLLKLFKGCDDNKLNLVKALIARAAYLTVNLEDLEAKILVYGWTDEYQNGREQSGRKKSAEADVHISLTKNLTAVMKQLMDLVPAAERKSKLEELMRQ